MSRTKLRLLVMVGVVVGVLTAIQAAALAEEPFLCPAVGNETAATANGNFGALTDGKYTFLPGSNQAGANANINALNTQNPTPGNVPGDGHSDWSPIWPGDTFE